jgi:hypothetical protein
MHEDYAALYKPIEMHWDVEARTASATIPGVLEIEVEPIRNSVTGEPHLARVVLPGGFEFNEAELASGSFSATGDLEVDYKDRAAIFSRFVYGPQGMVN